MIKTNQPALSRQQEANMRQRTLRPPCCLCHKTLISRQEHALSSQWCWYGCMVKDSPHKYVEFGVTVISVMQIWCRLELFFGSSSLFSKLKSWVYRGIILPPCRSALISASPGSFRQAQMAAHSCANQKLSSDCPDVCLCLTEMPPTSLWERAGKWANLHVLIKAHNELSMTGHLNAFLWYCANSAELCRFRSLSYWDGL